MGKTSLTFVIVYLNSPPPEYALQNMRRLNKLFPNTQLVYVTNIVTVLPTDIDAKIFEISTEKYQPLFETHSFDKTFRNGFWQSSLLRLIILSEIHAMLDSGPILHLEADVLLMPNFPLDRFMKSRKLLWTAFNSEVDVAALLYSPSLETTEFFSLKLLEMLAVDFSLTDMKALARFREQFPDKVALLPSSDSDLTYGDFGCLFDGAIFGMWLLGQDQRNHFGRLVRFKDLQESKYKIGEKAVLYRDRSLQLCTDGGTAIPLVNLHVHCKDPRIFNVDDRFLKNRVRQARSRITFPIFSTRIFLELLLTAIKMGEIKSFILHFPVVGRLLKISRTIYSRIR